MNDLPDGSSLDSSWLAAQVRPPVPRAWQVARPRLERVLDGVLDGRVGLVTAPRGGGKSTLVAAWLRRRTRAAWLSLDPGDNTPRRFFTAVVRALRAVDPELGEDLLPRLEAPRSPEPAELADLLARAVDAAPRRVVLAVDDYHVVERPEVHRALGELVRRSAAKLLLVVSTCTTPPPEIAGGRGVVELGADDLRFTTGEVRDLLAAWPEVDLGADDAETLRQRTGGLAAALELGALALSGRVDAGRLVAGLGDDGGGEGGNVLDQLTAAVLEHQDPELARFLLHTSVLRRLSGPLCDAVAGRDDSQALLVALEAARLPVAGLDDGRQWFRYHSLFRGLLRHRLTELEGREKLALLHGRASEWHLEGHPEEALEHAREAASPAQAVRVFVRHARPLLMRGHPERVGRWLYRLPREWLAAEPRLLVDRALMLFLSMRWGELPALLAKLEGFGDPDLEPELWALRTLVANSRHDWDEACEAARRALDGLPEEERYLRGLVIHLLGHALVGLGREGAARRAFERSVQWNVTCGDRLAALVAKCYLGDLDLAGARLATGLGHYRQGLRFVSGAGEAQSSGSLALAGQAEVYRLWAHFDHALDLARDAVEIGRRALGMGYLRGLLVLCRVHLSRGEPADAAAAADEALATLEGTGVGTWIGLAKAHWARVALARHRDAGAPLPDGVWHWATEAGLLDGWDDLESHLLPDHPRDYPLLAVARLLAASGDDERTLKLLAALERLELGAGWRRSLIECYVLQALARDRRGDDGAVGTLHQALTMAQPERLVAVFSDEGKPMTTLYARFLATEPRGFETAFLEQVRIALGS